MLIVTFDRPLHPGPVNLGNWRVFTDNFRWAALTMDAGAPAANQVTGTMNTTIGAPPGSTVLYLPPPFDVLSVPGLPAAGFVDFPLTVLP